MPEELAAGDFGDYVVRHGVTSADPNYEGLSVADRTVDLTDVDRSLSLLELRVAGELLPLKPAFAPGTLDYSADLPFEATAAFVREALTVNGDLVQRGAEVHFFPGGAALGRDSSVEVPLPAAMVGFEFRIQVSVEPLQPDRPVTYATYTLSLTRALPADARLEVLLAADRTPVTADTPLVFGADEDARELILRILSGGVSYGIRDVTLSDEALVNVQVVETVGDSEPQVRLTRVKPVANPITEDTPFEVTLTATPDRPLAAGADPFSVELVGDLLDNSPTQTELRVTYQGQDQAEAADVPADGMIRVSDNGTATLSLEVVHTGGGLRQFDGQAGFTFAVTAVGSRLNLDGNILGITAGPKLALSIAARGVDLENIDNPQNLIFTVVFEEPRANIQPQAGDAPLFDYYSELGDARPLFAFVGEENRLPLAVTLDEDSTLLADGANILRALPLAVAAPAARSGANTVTLTVGSSGDSARALLFEVTQPQANVAVNVSVAELSEQVDVAPLNFTAHLLRLQHEADVTIGQEPVILEFSLADELINGTLGLNEASSWTLTVANELQLAGNGYEVEEVISAGTSMTTVSDILTQITTVEATQSQTKQVEYTRERRTLVLRGGGTESDTRTAPETLSAGDLSGETLALFTSQMRTVTLVVSEMEATTYAPADGAYRRGAVEIAPRTRTLRIRRPDAAVGPALASRLVLTFEYRPAAGPAGSFNRIVDIGGVIPALVDAGIFAAGSDTALDGDAVLSRGRSVVLDLVVSNLLAGEEPLPDENIAIAINYPPGLGLVVEPQEGRFDAINRRYVLPLTVTLAQDAAGPDYLVSIRVSLAGRGRTAAASFRVDVNDPPQFDSDSPTVLEVDESGAGNVMEFQLRVFDPDGGLQKLAAADLMLEVVGFAGAAVDPIAPFAVDGASEEGVPYFDLAFGPVKFQDGGEGDNFDNALDLTLTLTGKLATPGGAVVELRLFGATDGEEVLDERLSVIVSDVPPTFTLERTTISLRGGEEVEVPLPRLHRRRRRSPGRRPGRGAGAGCPGLPGGAVRRDDGSGESDSQESEPRQHRPGHGAAGSPGLSGRPGGGRAAD